MKEPFGDVAKPPRTIDRISPNSEGGMSLKSVQEFEDQATKTKLKTILEAEGIDIEEKNLDTFLPDEAKLDKGPKTKVISEFVRDLYESAGVKEPLEGDATNTQPPNVDPLAESTFASDACQCAEIGGDEEWKNPKTSKKAKKPKEIGDDEEWKTPKTSKKIRKPKNPCDQLSPINIIEQIISKVTGAQMESSGSASDSTTYKSPNRNPYSPLAEDNNDDSENPIPPPITDIESILAISDQIASREASDAHGDES